MIVGYLSLGFKHAQNGSEAGWVVLRHRHMGARLVRNQNKMPQKFTRTMIWVLSKKDNPSPFLLLSMSRRLAYKRNTSIDKKGFKVSVSVKTSLLALKVYGTSKYIEERENGELRGGFATFERAVTIS